MGGGTGFCTLGVVETVRPENVTLVDQSPHQLSKARQKKQLQGVTIMEVGLGRLPHLHTCWSSYNEQSTYDLPASLIVK